MGFVVREWHVSLPVCQMQNLRFHRFYHAPPFRHQNLNTMSSTISRVHLICISCSRCGMLYIGEIARSLRTKFGEHPRAAIGNDANLPVAKHFNTGIDSVSDIQIVPISFRNMELSPRMALMNIILSKADIDSTFNSYLNPYLFHIYCCICCSFLNICVSIFCNVIYISCLYIVLTKSIRSVNFLSSDRFYFLSI